ncbi:GTP-binding protein Rit2 [Mizuhopecten yessoensis]|uniref:GTP-binding protein Rit2 n=1 Tax=Mizuhopecten yessoensis TaxID=6573 RepID=A0A210QYZ2_MIZYE|nr:GTP-binding protein Rit2 [Mizuhopecten yessoensis]
MLLGAESVGKSAIMKQFINEAFTDNNTQTVADCYQHVIKLPSGLYRHIQILDTGSLNQFPAMRDLSIRLGHAFAVVYAVDDYDSFNTAIDMCNHIYQIKGTRNVRIVLVGNKLDATGCGRLISTECGLKLASRSLKCAFVETSAKLKLNVSCLFQTLLPEE